ncbi:MAG: hypothetical protein HOJ35_10135 [Bdellovibrionales bacterium]|jgi:hypothetical protein|nr:hypothetical protein [Bdellovibrionales bacterium]
MDKSISRQLISSCEELYSENVINDEQYLKCKTSIDDSGYYDRLKVSEKQIFRNSRNARDKKYNNFINQVEVLVTNIFKNINDEAGGTTSEYEIPREKWNDYYDILTVLNAVIIDIVENINKKAVKLYGKKEKNQYNQLLQFYNNIDGNRKELDILEKRFNTLDKVKVIRDDKLLHAQKESGSRYTAFVVLLVLNILFLVILILIIKFRQ